MRVRVALLRPPRLGVVPMPPMRAARMAAVTAVALLPPMRVRVLLLLVLRMGI